MQTQKRGRVLEVELKELTTNYNQLTYDHELLKQSNAKLIKQIDDENQRRFQFDKDSKQYQQDLYTALNREKQMQEDLERLQKENLRLTEEFNNLNNEYKTVELKHADVEEQLDSKDSFIT